jgi:hypothetical protein
MLKNTIYKLFKAAKHSKTQYITFRFKFDYTTIFINSNWNSFGNIMDKIPCLILELITLFEDNPQEKFIIVKIRNDDLLKKFCAILMTLEEGPKYIYEFGEKNFIR